MLENPLTRRLNTYVALEDSDRSLLHDITTRVRSIHPGDHISRDDRAAGTVHLVLEGFAYRHKMLADGRRQIIAYMLPGDFCDLCGLPVHETDHGLTALSACKVVDIPLANLALLNAQPRLGRALWKSCLVDQAILREWIVNIGARSAEARIGHFFCEMISRLQIVGMSDLTDANLPLTQNDLAETLGLSLVHTNRSLQHLRSRGLSTFSRTRLHVPDFGRLAAESSFTGRYLQVAGDPVAYCPPPMFGAPANDGDRYKGRSQSSYGT